jgi:hypothetical protein
MHIHNFSSRILLIDLNNCTILKTHKGAKKGFNVLKQQRLMHLIGKNGMWMTGCGWL